MLWRFSKNATVLRSPIGAAHIAADSIRALPLGIIASRGTGTAKASAGLAYWISDEGRKYAIP